MSNEVPPSIYPDTGTAYARSVDSAAQIAHAPQRLSTWPPASRAATEGRDTEQWQALVATGVDEGQPRSSRL